MNADGAFVARARLEIYMDSPVSDQERRTLLDNVLAEIKTEDDKDFVAAKLTISVEDLGLT